MQAPGHKRILAIFLRGKVLVAVLYFDLALQQLPLVVISMCSSVNLSF